MSQLVAVGNSDACALLAAMLQGKQAEERNPGYILAWCVYTEHAALIMRVIVYGKRIVFVVRGAVYGLHAFMVTPEASVRNPK